MRQRLHHERLDVDVHIHPQGFIIYWSFPLASPFIAMASEGELLQSTDALFSNLLTPGSSLHPTFQRILDGAFALLFLVFVGLAVVTRGSVHIFALMAIEIGLWLSVKWFVSELQKTQVQVQGQVAGIQQMDVSDDGSCASNRKKEE
ncbi:hypothetical protein OBBRIDRAFT_832497 [Obba rivulosa]|uniref:Uncharacterized protein n=1 Tax=Obba rivulosa TaxID=1052685 RepID=A0A8E2J2X7_9APHY|nr:hypothetical protein OBBRIDRAFT_832497 [Obba rivulosa]